MVQQRKCGEKNLCVIISGYENKARGKSINMYTCNSNKSIRKYILSDANNRIKVIKMQQLLDATGDCNDKLRPFLESRRI